jgi:hypothetical protein
MVTVLANIGMQCAQHAINLCNSNASHVDLDKLFLDSMQMNVTTCTWEVGDLDFFSRLNSRIGRIRVGNASSYLLRLDEHWQTATLPMCNYIVLSIGRINAISSSRIERAITVLAIKELTHHSFSTYSTTIAEGFRRCTRIFTFHHLHGWPHQRAWRLIDYSLWMYS